MTTRLVPPTDSTAPSGEDRPAQGASLEVKKAKPRVVAGAVALLGAGPGDPGLLTVRAVEAIRAADVVVGDLALHAAVVERYARADAERVDTSEAGLTDTELARVLVRHAKEGRSVVRLFSGDPFLAGHGAEVAAALAKARVAFEVVPGVSSATAVPAYAGVPLTTGKASEVRVADVSGKGVAWDSLGAGSATLVLLGAESRLAEVSERLVAGGRPASTPAAATCNGTTTQQQTVVTTLGQLAVDAQAVVDGCHGQVVVVVGDVVSQRDKLSWFETKALFGWRVLVPRTREQAGALSEQLRTFGAVPEEVPTIAVEPPRTPQQVERAVKGLVTGRYEWIAFTSRNAVKAIREKFEEYGLDARAFSGIKVAAVGEQTAADLRSWGIVPDLVPSGEQSSAGLLAEWPEYDPVLDPIDRVFLPRADIATETLVAGLTQLGWQVEDVTAYRTVRAAPPAAPIRDAIKSGGFDAVLFTSSSTVRNLVGIAGKPHATTVVACIGPATAKTAEEHGLRVDVLAPEPSVAALARALADYGSSLRLAAVEAGEPVLKPSEKRPSARRKAK
ncbi:uroporphyrinogen III methyltransferase/synthase [Motilibacter rhizosphaerae]|uniref:uroporphyrinogen-III C-methyltransferase n=1 Tax=Motilibacter rhizosphaerae TaxID=598652 RepID=A0A4V2F2R4_9ACTN|nr:uroporphyrinogen-III synthase [Motilibacter rhizosphaerae]RZS79058.1 uroporphyrinogen III methyltransferase/synthase [Motilibacter rhizosphaerae]